MTGREHRNLPTAQIDRIRRGTDLRQGGNKAVRGALVSTAMSAIQCGWTYPEWVELLDETASTLGRQARSDRGRRDLPKTRYITSLHNAWKQAQKNIDGKPAHTTDDARAQVRDLRHRLDDHDAWPNRATDRTILGYALDVAERNGTSRPALPLRPAAEAASVTPSMARRALGRLCRAGYLTLDTRGRPYNPNDPRNRDPHRRPLASLYRLRADAPIPVSVNGPVCQKHLTYVPVAADPTVPNTLTYVPVAEKGSLMSSITVTLDPDGRLILNGPPAVLERAVAAMQAGQPVVVAGTDSTSSTEASSSPRYLHAVPEQYGDADDGDRPGGARSLRGRGRPA